MARRGLKRKMEEVVVVHGDSNEGSDKDEEPQEEVSKPKKVTRSTRGKLSGAEKKSETKVAKTKEDTEPAKPEVKKTKGGRSTKKTPGKKVSKEEEKKINYWLLKSEPETRIEKGVDVKFGIDDLMEEPGQTACWDGVRNYAARNFMKDMKIGDKGFFYHSNCKVPGIAGIVEIVKESYPDHTQFDSKDPHYYPKAKKDNPTWYMVDVKYERKLQKFISLHDLKELHQKHKKTAGPLAGIALFTKARLSVQPISKDEWDFILSMEE